ncbi:MAG: hypothetical protein MJ211_13580 [Bacteroidales bacterium]|nr:hypothetical protein [Bacteroidales bacterium]
MKPLIIIFVGIFCILSNNIIQDNQNYNEKLKSHPLDSIPQKKIYNYSINMNSTIVIKTDSNGNSDTIITKNFGNADSTLIETFNNTIKKNN